MVAKRLKMIESQNYLVRDGFNRLSDMFKIDGTAIKEMVL
jgi:hypothetical protein